MKKIAIHPAALVFPQMSDREIQDLADDIKKNGLKQPITLYQGKILDGRNRFLACQMAGIEPHFEDWDGEGSPVAWVLSMNLTRRHLTASQRAVISLDILPLLEEEAKQRQRKGRRQSKESTNGKATEHAATITKANSRYVEKAKYLSRNAPDLLEPVRAGKMNLSSAEQIARLPAEERQKIIHENRLLKDAAEIRRRRRENRAVQLATPTTKGKPSTWEITDDEKVVPCDLLIVDPPYGITREPWEPQNLEQFTRKWASDWSKANAEFIAIFWSQAKLFDGRKWFDESLVGYSFQQLLVWHIPNNYALRSRRELKRTWEPIFLFRRTASKKEIISSAKSWDGEMTTFDCHTAPIPQKHFQGQDEKEHPCQKPVSVMRWLVNALSDKNDRVVSLYCGVAPCGIAALSLGRRYRGIERDPRYRDLARSRIAEFA